MVISGEITEAYVYVASALTFRKWLAAFIEMMSMNDKSKDKYLQYRDGLEWHH